MIINQKDGQAGAVISTTRAALHCLIKRFGVLLVFTPLCFLQGCGEHDYPTGMTKQAVKFEDVPENVRAAAKKAIPGVTLNEAWKNLEREGKLHSYEIRGKNAADGKTREVRVSLTGEILETE